MTSLALAYKGNCFFSLTANMCLQGRCIVFQKVHWQLLTVTVRFPAEDETTEFASLCSTMVIFLRKFSCLMTKSNAKGVSILANCSSGDSGGKALTLFLTIAIRVTWSRSFRRQDSTAKNSSKKVDKFAYLEQTLLTFAFMLSRRLLVHSPAVKFAPLQS